MKEERFYVVGAAAVAMQRRVRGAVFCVVRAVELFLRQMVLQFS
jgi:hypothetical protein